MVNKKVKVSKKTLDLIKKNQSVKIDLACGSNKQGKDWIGVDVRPLPGVDIVHDLETFPYPLPDECATTILCSHYIEHINPAKFGFINFMNEVHRIMKPNGRFLISMPYSLSHGFVQDPTHVNPCNETTWGYFSPTHPSGLYGIYTPKPWFIIANAFHTNGNMEVVLEKIPSEDVKLENGVMHINSKWANMATKGGR